jgi:hypothetical protein
MNKWKKLGKYPGPTMWAYDFMRIENTFKGWRAWDVLRVPEIRPMFPTTFHETLRAAKLHCETVVNSSDLTAVTS